MTCSKCQKWFNPHFSPFVVPDPRDVQHIELNTFCPHCETRYYAFIPALNWAREDHAKALLENHNAKSHR